MYPISSHIRPTLPIARHLRDAGHEVIYIVFSEDIKAFIESEGFSTEFFADPGDNHFKRTRFAAYNRYVSFQLLNKKLMQNTLFDPLIKKYTPGLLCVDVMFAEYCILLSKYGVNIALLNTFLQLDRASNIPPFTSSFIPGERSYSRMITNLEWKKYYLYRLLSGLRVRATSLGATYGLSSRRFLKKLAARHDYNYRENFVHDRFFKPGFRHIPEFILTPRNFDFPRVSRTNVFYLNPLPVVAASAQPDDKVAHELASIRSQYKTVVYCAFGNLNVSDLIPAAEFWKKLCAVIAGLPDYFLILATGRSEVAIPLSGNILTFGWAPQQLILQYSDIMVTHAGLNSVQECINEAVPMIAYPLNPRLDQNGNAARIVYHRIGERGNINESQSLIRQRLLAVGEDLGLYKKNLESMRNEYLASSDFSTNITVLEQLAGVSQNTRQGQKLPEPEPLGDLNRRS